MEVRKRLCIKDFTVETQDGDDFTVEKGKKYTVSTPGHSMSACGPEPILGRVIVFSSYYVSVPEDHFSNE